MSLLLSLACCLVNHSSSAPQLTVGQQFAEIGDLKLTSGATLRRCRVGYRTIGTLNSTKSNAVLVPTWFMGKSEDLASIFKAGAWVDSSKYFIIAVDALGNGVSSSPSNSKLQPEGKFPTISIRDMVESQHAVLTQLGITHLRAVTGISMGGVQTFQWMTAYPTMMDCAIPIVGSPRPTSYDLMDYGSGIKALQQAIKNPGARKLLITTMADYFLLSLRTPSYYARKTDRATAVSGMVDFENAVLAWDPYDLVCDLKALNDNDILAPFGESSDRAAAAVKSKVLVISATQDHCVNPASALAFAGSLSAPVLLLESDSGHQSAGEEMPRISAAIAKLLG